MQTWRGETNTWVNNSAHSIAISKEVKDLDTHGDVISHSGPSLLQDRHLVVVPTNNFTQAARHASSHVGDGVASCQPLFPEVAL